MKKFKILITVIIICFMFSINNPNDYSYQERECDSNYQTIKRLAKDIDNDWGIYAMKIPMNISNIDKSKIVKVAVIDTGVNIDSKNLLEGYNVIEDSKNVFDYNAHGSNVATIILKVNPNACTI